MNKSEYTKAMKYLGEFTATDIIEEKEINVPVFSNGVDNIIISGEDENSYLFADYWREFHNDGPWINPALEAGLKALGFELDWNNAGSVGVYPA